MTILWHSLITISLFLLFAWLARRLLGVRRLSAVRTVLASLMGLVLGDLVAVFLYRQGTDRDVAIATGIILGLVFAMLAIVTLELLSDPVRRQRGSKLKNPIAMLSRSIDSGRRSVEVTRIASKHGLGRGFGASINGTMSDAEAAAYGADLRAALEEAGGVFVKLGQLLATRPDVVHPVVAESLGTLHQDVEPAARSDIQPLLEAALDRSVDEAFQAFDWAPIGSGSLGQVYRATMKTGDEVVVKVRRPNIEEEVNRDLRIALDLASFVEERNDDARQLGVLGVADQFAAQLSDELDYRVEARSTVEAGASLAASSSIVAPAVFESLSSEDVLVIEFIEGRPLGRSGAIDGGQGRRLADQLFEAELSAMLSGERFHADPHPGNVMLRPDGGLALIDFGSTGRLDVFERSAVAGILTGLAHNDPSMLRSSALDVGMGGGDIDPDQLDRAFARLMADHLGPGAEPTAAMLQDFLSITNRFGLRMPTSVTEMLRALATLQGSLEVLSPGYPVIDAARAMASDRMTEALAPENLADEAKAEIIRVAPLLRRMPHHLDRIAGQIEKGNLSVRVSMFSNPADLRALSGLLNRFVLAFIGASLGVVSVMLLQLDSGILITDNFRLFDILGVGGLFAGVILIMRVVVEVLREQ